MADGKQIALRIPGQALSEIDALFREQGLIEWTIKSKGGHRVISGRTCEGGAVRFSSYSSDGYSERTSSRSAGLSTIQRQKQAKRLSKQRLTQNEIAERLGCSQKTISNDLRL